MGAKKVRGSGRTRSNDVNIDLQKTITIWFEFVNSKQYDYFFKGKSSIFQKKLFEIKDVSC